MRHVIEDFVPQGGTHCITNALKQVFFYHGYPLTEAMMFGLASGLSFLYINQAHSPMVNGRSKIFEFEAKLAQRLNITIKCKTTKDYDKAVSATKKMIDANDPVLIYVDMPYLKYLSMDQNSHFGGHSVVLFGYDDASEKFWLSDRDNHDYPIRTPKGDIKQDYHIIDYAEIEQARKSSFRPFPANNKYLLFDFDGYKQIGKDVLCEAIKETCDTMLHPPAQLLGINGILKFAKEIRKWKQFDTDKLKTSGVTNYFMIHQDGGTGGGIFRKMYGEFLIEAASIIEDNAFAKVGEKFMVVARAWDKLADELWELSIHGDRNLLPQMSAEILTIYKIEKQLYEVLHELVDAER